MSIDSATMETGMTTNGARATGHILPARIQSAHRRKRNSRRFHAFTLLRFHAKPPEAASPNTSSATAPASSKPDDT